MYSMKRLATCVSAIALACTASHVAWAQYPGLFNGSFETQAFSPLRAKGWRHFPPTQRRTAGDGFLPAAIVRTGSFSLETPSGEVLSGFDTAIFVDAMVSDQTYDPVYSYGCGPAMYSVWIAIPATHPLTVQRAGLKFEPRRANNSMYESFERFLVGPESFGGTGHTNGQWVQISATLTQADFEWKFNFYNDTAPFDGIGVPHPDFPNRMSLVNFRFGDPFAGEMGTIFWDDAEFSQHFNIAGDPIEVWDDMFLVGTAIVDNTVIEPSVPLYLNGTRLGYPCLAGDDSFDIVNLNDLVPDTSSFPLTWADIIANGYVRPLVQSANGTSQIGTSVITGPSFKPSGQPLDLIPSISRADIAAAVAIPPDRDLDAFPDPLFGTPERTDAFKITGTGNYGPATLNCERDYSTDPQVGLTTFKVTYTFTTTANITLDATATGRGFDAFRLMTLSSMLADIGMGDYDARFIAVEDGAGQTRTLAIDDAPRGVYLYSAPQPTGVGRSMTLFQDTGGTFNPGSPTIEVELLSLSITGTPSPTVGVNAFLASSTDPNDDSLSAWLEWTNAPATINSGTVVQVMFMVRATFPTDVGDVDHDRDRDCTDVALLVALCGLDEADATFNAYADVDGDGDIDGADRAALEAITGACPAMGCAAAPPCCVGNANKSPGVVNFGQIITVLGNFGSPANPNGTSVGDANCDGFINFLDIIAILANFGSVCP